MNAYQIPADPTAVVGRRIGSYVINSILLAAALFLGARLADLKSEEVPDGFGDSFGDVCDVIEQDSNINTCFEFNDTVYYSDSSSAAVMVWAPWVIVAVLNHIVLAGATGASVGKHVFGLRVVKQGTGQLAGYGAATLRSVLWIVDAFPYCFPLVALVTELTTKGHRRVGDMAAGTLVVAKSAVGVPPMVPGMPAPAMAGAYAPAPAGAGWSPPAPSWGAPPPPAAPPSDAWGAPPPAAPSPDPWAAPASPTPSYEPPAPVPSYEPPAPPPETGAWAPASPEPSPEAAEPPSAWDAPAPAPAWEPRASAEPPADATVLPPEPEPAWEPEPAPAPAWEPTTVLAPEPEPEPAPPAAEPEPAPAAAEPAAAAEQPGVGAPMWDAARNAYIQWDPSVGSWMQWDDAAGQWRPIS